MFATAEGRRKLLGQSKFQRMAVVTMHRDQDYKSLDDIKSELSDSVKCFSPIGLKEQVRI